MNSQNVQNLIYFRYTSLAIVLDNHVIQLNKTTSDLSGINQLLQQEANEQENNTYIKVKGAFNLKKLLIKSSNVDAESFKNPDQKTFII